MGITSPVLHRYALQNGRGTEGVCADGVFRTPGTKVSVRPQQTLDIFSFRVAGLNVPCSYGPLLNRILHRTSQNIAGGEQISTGVDRTYAEAGVSQTSVIVLVTPEGNIPARAN